MALPSSYDPHQVADVYRHQFAARVDAYSRWTPDGWRPVREELTPEIVLAGLRRTGPSISGFLIAPGSVSHVLAVDFDAADGREQAALLAQRMDADGIPAYIEASRRGAHLWCCLDRPAPAIAIRTSLMGLLQDVGITLTPKVELRPGSDRLPDGGLGHALRMPLMPHPVTGIASKLATAQGEIVGQTVAQVLLNIEWAPAEKLLEWAERYRRPPVTAIPKTYRYPRLEPYEEETATASELLRDVWGVPGATPGRSVRCPAHDDLKASLSILRDDRRVICKSPGCILNNGDRGRGTHELRKLGESHAGGTGAPVAV